MSETKRTALERLRTKAASLQKPQQTSSTNEVQMRPMRKSSSAAVSDILPGRAPRTQSNTDIDIDLEQNTSEAPLLDLANMDDEDQVEFYDKQVAGIRYGVSVSGLVLVSVLIVLVSIFIWALTSLGYFVAEQTQVVIATVCFVLPLFVFVLLSLVKNIIYLGWVLGLAYSVLSILVAANGLYDVIDTIDAAAKLASTTGKYDVTVYLTSAIFNIILLALCVSVVYMLLTVIWEVSELANYRPRVKSKKRRSET